MLTKDEEKAIRHDNECLTPSDDIKSESMIWLIFLVLICLLIWGVEIWMMS